MNIYSPYVLLNIAGLVQILQQNANLRTTLGLDIKIWTEDVIFGAKFVI